MEKTYINQTPDKVEENVKVIGWVHNRRDHGKLIFIDLRDSTGLIQVVFGDDFKQKELAEKLRSEWVIEIDGKINKRPEKMINTDLITGTVEMKAEKLTILSEAETPPFELTNDGREIGEEHRLKYRYLDLRRERLQKNLRDRHMINNYIRSFFSEKDFIEVETPFISKSTPEGARDYLVPSRLQKGKFYALPQSPQQYKQLLMVAGLERYFQIVRCFRDEDTRGDRQPEFTQLDLEMSFVEKRDILELMEELFLKLVEEKFPNKKISKKPFPRITYKEAMDKYGSDRPDMRKDKNNPDELAFCFVVDFPMFEEKKDSSLGATHHPFTKIKNSEEGFDSKNPLKLLAEQYDLVLNGEEIGGGSIREHDPKVLSEVFEILGHTKEEIDRQFGHLLKAFSFGAPPHGGIALGLDRIIMVLTKEPNIREVIAFPKTGDGRDLMMDSPSEISKEQLKELGLKIDSDVQD